LRELLNGNIVDDTKTVADLTLYTYLVPLTNSNLNAVFELKGFESLAQSVIASDPTFFSLF